MPVKLYKILTLEQALEYKYVVHPEDGMIGFATLWEARRKYMEEIRRIYGNKMVIGVEE